MPHSLLIPDATRARLAEYLVSLQSHDAHAGGYLAAALAGHELAAITEAELLDALLNTKLPQIFAESAVAGNGSDWNLTELGILGDISIAVPVSIFGKGKVWGGDPLECPCCKSTMKPVRTFLRREDIEFFLRLHGLWAMAMVDRCGAHRRPDAPVCL
jgi:hypothetical protein